MCCCSAPQVLVCCSYRLGCSVWVLLCECRGPFGAASRQGMMQSFCLQDLWPATPAWGGGGCLPSIQAASSSTFTRQS